MDQNYPRNGYLFGLPAYFYDTGSEAVQVGCRNSMADGRVFTDYRPDCRMNQLIRYAFNINNSRDYREFLQQNAEKLRNMDRVIAARNASSYCNCDRSFVNYGHDLNQHMSYDYVLANGGVRPNTSVLFQPQPVSETLYPSSH